MEPVVELRGVGVSLGGHPVLRDVNLTVESGETVGVAGPNGSGKTTLIRSAATLQAIDSGTATVLGQDTCDTNLTTARRAIGLVGHQPAVIDELTLEENLHHIARLAGVDPSRVDRALEVVGLTGAADRRAVASSFGMLRRIEIASLLLTRPSLLLLDEAASGLDETARDLVQTLIGSVCDRGGAALVVSHDRSHLTDLTTRVLSLRSGRLEVPS